MLNIRYREKTNAWPGFVDLFSNLVIILIFLLMVFLALFVTTGAFNKNTGAKKVAALEQEKQMQAKQIDQLTEDDKVASQLLLAARDALEVQEEKINIQQRQQENLANAYEQRVTELSEQQMALAEQIAELTNQLHQEQVAKEEMARMESERKTMQDELSNRIAELQAELENSEEIARQKEVEYVEMSNRLNKALADKVAELNNLAQYQSEFYKQVKIALGDRTSIRQDGDRFIVSSDILFPSGSYTVSKSGKEQLRLLANVIKDFENKIPTDVDWIIRVDGHTDNKAVLPDTRGYKNNMQLSLLRATAVVNELVKNGVSKRRLVPSGFGEMHPVELGNDKESLHKNRRIELQLTNK